MTLILEGAAVLCLLYYGVIVAYSGVTTSFALFWPVMAVCLSICAAAVHYHIRHPRQLPVWMTVGAVTFVSVCIAIFLLVEFLIGLGAVTSTRQPVDYVIVLGAQVRGEEISSSLKKRLDKAIKYAENNPNTMLVLSGGQGDGEDVSEAQAMHDYLVYNGVANSQLLREAKSTNTRENISFSREVIERHEHWKAALAKQKLEDSYQEPDYHDVKIAVLTNNFHVFRAKEIAKKQGIRDIHGISASCDMILAPHYWIRECFAVLKDKFMGAM